MYIFGCGMRVAKWGNSLAVRLPDAVVKALKLNRSRERALERLRALKKPLPKGFRFDRDEANAR
jgi:antitoxin MazE